jgi:hypothetical protein
MPTFEVKNMSDFFEAILKITRMWNGEYGWWRGQSSEKWDLVPSVYRQDYARNEHNMAFRFKHMAKTRYHNCPQNDDAHPWLFLMQHYGLPTRLLDWSESPLVALFFAVQNNNRHHEDGCLWVLRPTQLNLKQIGSKGIFTPSASECTLLFKDVFERNANRDQKMLAILTDETDIRHLVQRSVFTIHGTTVPLNKIESSDDLLVKLVIPSKSKASLNQMLNLAGISRAYLFPDLTNLAHELSNVSYIDKNDLPQ